MKTLHYAGFVFFYTEPNNIGIIVLLKQEDGKWKNSYERKVEQQRKQNITCDVWRGLNIISGHGKDGGRE